MIDDQEKVEKNLQTTGQALQVIQQLCKRYIPVLEKIIAIKNNPPQAGEAIFGRAKTQNSQTNLQTLKDAAEILLQHTVDIRHQLEQKNVTTYDIDRMDDPYLNYVLLNMVREAITRMETCYAGQATSFAILLNELTRLSHALHSQLTLSEQPIDTVEGMAKLNATLGGGLQSGEQKMIYIRVFHRDLPKLGESAAGMNCIPILLEMVQFCEKNGLAVYDEWSLAERSLRNESYGFFSACIDAAQDLSAYAPAKRDRYLDCALLTIQKVELFQLRQFRHRNKTYWVQKDKLIEV